jgi:hypothetical protein
MSLTKWKSLICIDDSGTPGCDAPSLHLHKNRKTWVAIFFNEDDISLLDQEFPIVLNAIKERFGEDELHFTDIYSGKREWKDVSLEDRMFIFETFCDIFAARQFELIVQTLSPDNISEHNLKEKQMEGPFDLSKPEEAALAFLLARINMFCREHQDEYPMPTRIVVDSGWKNSGYILPLHGFDQAGGQIEFQDSKKISGLQFADFVAFSLNRSQWISAKKEKSRLDITMLKLFEKADFNFINIPKMIVNSETFSIEDYGRFHEEDRVKKGLKPRPWEKSRHHKK